MQLHFTSQKFEVTQAFKDFVTEKFQHLDKFLENDTMINLIFKIEKSTQIAEATIKIKKINIHAKAEADNMYNAVDELIDKLKKQLIKHKDKMKDHRDSFVGED